MSYAITCATALLVSGLFNDANRLLTTVFVFLLYTAAFATSAAWAGPPFITDDPETVEYQHGEFYIASQ
jgi:hypothetical protein